jgi:hypothetical protein
VRRPGRPDAHAERALFLKVDDQVPTVTVNGQVFTVTEMGGCTAVTANIVEKIEICSSITITIPVMALGPGEFDVVVTNPGTASCVSTSAIKVKVNPPPRVDAVVPQNVCAGGSILTITGQNFLMGQNGELPRIELRGMDQAPIVATAIEMSQPGTELKATFGPGPTAGTAYDVVVINPDGCEDRPLPHKQVKGVEGPDPLLRRSAGGLERDQHARHALRDGDQQAAADGRGVDHPGGAMSPVTVLEHNDVVGYPKRLQAVVPAGLAAGSYDVHSRTRRTARRRCCRAGSPSRPIRT